MCFTRTFKEHVKKVKNLITKEHFDLMSLISFLYLL